MLVTSHCSPGRASDSLSKLDSLNAGDIDNDREDATLVQAIINVSKNLNLVLIIEGVELNSLEIFFQRARLRTCTGTLLIILNCCLLKDRKVI